MLPSLDPGAFHHRPASCVFTVWAPRVQRVTLRLVGPVHRDVPMQPVQRGYHQAHVEGIAPGQRYLYRLDNGPERPDPASRWQPDGVHRPSAVDDPSFEWQDSDWRGASLDELVLYELHVGTFTPEGTFDAAIGQLQRLADLGVTALSLMPVAQFPGVRNWGYDGVYPYAVQASYGGSAGLKRLVDAAHRRGLSVILDVVYNHLGPEGNYLRDFGPYFSDQYRTPWGEPLNFDGPGSDEVRHFFLANTLRWQDEFHLDGLRLDSVPFIKDLSAYHVLAELSDLARRWSDARGRPFHLIGESDLNDGRILRPRDQGGLGLDAQWSDDFHHALHAYLTGERQGYYADHGELDHLIRAYRDVFVLDGRYSHFRGRRYGAAVADRPGRQFVIFAQNHDQVGNRPRAERLSTLVDFESLKMVAALLLAAPHVPMLFMGEEYGETAPFPFFVNHGDGRLLDAIRRGRQRDFAAFGGQGEPFDPANEATFQRAKIRPEQANHGRGKALHEWYGELLRLRRSLPALAVLDRTTLEVRQAGEQPVLLMRRRAGESEAALAFNLSQRPERIAWPLGRGNWLRLLDSADGRWQGPGSQVPQRLASEAEIDVSLAARSAVLLVRERA